MTPFPASTLSNGECRFPVLRFPARLMTTITRPTGAPRRLADPSTSGLARTSEILRTRRLGFRQSVYEGSKTLSGANVNALLDPPDREQTRDQEANRVAHVPAHLLDTAEGRWRRHQGHARAAAARFEPSDHGHVYAGGDLRETPGAECSCSSVSDANSPRSPSGCRRRHCSGLCSLFVPTTKAL